MKSSQELVNNLAPLAKYAKYIAYQLLGIYFPAASLMIYLLILWGPNFLPIENNPLLKDNIYGKLIVFAIFTILIGESINAISSRYTTISPVPLSLTEKMNYLFRRKKIASLLISELGGSDWPTWLNESHYPISFDTFDRYFLLRVDLQKKPIAGRLGWIAFYRNFFSVFVIVLSLNIILPYFTSIDVITASMPTDSIILLTLFLTAVLSIVFYFGYRVQNETNSSILWNAYRRNELTKSLEAKYGDLPLALGIDEKFKIQALDYIIDRWFLAVESAIKAVSSVIYSEAEREYAIFKSGKKSYTHVRTISKIIPHKRDPDMDLQRHLVRAASSWHDGEYETVINDCLMVLEHLNKKPDNDFWKFIKGFYLFEDELFTKEAFSEIQSNANRWKWVYNNSEKKSSTKQKSPKNINQNTNNSEYQAGIIHSSRISIYKTGITHKDLLWESGDPFSRTTAVISKALFGFEACRSQLAYDEDERCLNFIKCILADFGGFDYGRVIMKANTLVSELDTKCQARKNKKKYGIKLKCEQHTFDKREKNWPKINNKIPKPNESIPSTTVNIEVTFNQIIYFINSIKVEQMGPIGPIAVIKGTTKVKPAPPNTIFFERENISGNDFLPNEEYRITVSNIGDSNDIDVIPAEDWIWKFTAI